MAERVQTTALFGLLCADRFTTVDDILRSALAHPAATDPPLVGTPLSALSALSLSWQGSLVAADEEYARGDGRTETVTTGPTAPTADRTHRRPRPAGEARRG